MARILIADDDLSIRALLDEILWNEGYEVFQAATGAQAVEIARAEQPDLVRIDLRMPVLDGGQAARILKSDPQTSGSRIIALSAERNLHQASAHLPIDGLLGKPFDVDTLLADVARHLQPVSSSDQLAFSPQ